MPSSSELVSSASEWLGATASDVLRAVMGRSARLIVAGLAVGLTASVALTRVIAGCLFGVAHWTS
jgi:hypothetical protein